MYKYIVEKTVTLEELIILPNGFYAPLYQQSMVGLGSKETDCGPVPFVFLDNVFIHR